MNEEALQDSYNLFRAKGYKGSLPEYINLLNTNPDALNDSFSLFSNAGYSKSIDDYKVLIGVSAPVKKKEDTESLSEDGLSVSPPSIDFTDYTQMVSSPIMQDAERKQADLQIEAPQSVEEAIEVTQQPVAFTQEQYDYQALGDVSSTTDGRIGQRKELMKMYEDVESSISLSEQKEETKALDKKAQRKKISDKIRQLDATVNRERGILDASNVPTFKQVIDGARPPEGINVESLIEMGARFPKAAESSYINQVRLLQEEQKKSSGYIEFNGKFYDPDFLPEGFGFDAALSSLSFDYLAGQEEEEVVPLLNQKFMVYGFQFNEMSDGDKIAIKSPNGKTIYVSLDNWSDEADAKSAKQMKAFLVSEYSKREFSDKEKVEQAMFEPSNLGKVGLGTEYDYDEAYTNNGYDSRRIKTMNKDAAALKEYVEYFKAEQTSVEAVEAELKMVNKALKDNSRDDWTRQKKASLESSLVKLKTNLSDHYNTALKVEAEYTGMVDQYRRVAGTRALSNMEWDLSNLTELFVGEYLRGAAGTLSGYLDSAADLTAILLNNFYKGISGEDFWKDEDLKAWKKEVKTPVKTAGELAAAVLFSGADPLTLSQEGSVTIDKEGGIKLGGGYVGKETVDKLNATGFIGQGLTGVTRSLPAMMTGPLRIASFYAMGSEHLDEEMNKNPAFANMTEVQKLYLKIPLGLVVATLEEFGLRNVLSNSSLVSKITLGAIKSFGKKTAVTQTSRTFNEVIKKEIRDTVGGRILKGTILAASSGAAEYETGALQEVADIYGKEIWDAVKGEDYFDNVVDLTEGGKDAFNMDVVVQANKAGLAEMVGGIVMGMPGAVTQASQNNNFEELDEGRFAIFKEISREENVEDFLNYQKSIYNSAVGIAKSPFVGGETLTQEEADFIIDTYEEVIALSRTVKSEYSGSYQKKIMNLVSQRKALQKQVDALDKATTKEQQRQIELINEDIAQLTFEADKELAESTREYDKLKSEGKVTTDFKSWRTRHLLEEKISEAVAERDVSEVATAKEVVTAVTEVETESREDMEKRAKKELRQQERQRRAAEKKEFKGKKIKGAKQEKYVPTQEEIDTKVEEYVQEQEAQQEAQVLKWELEAKGREKFKPEAATEEATEQSVLDEEWNNEMQENKDAQLEAAEKQLKEEKGPGRRRMLVGRRQAPVITQEEILQRAKENLNEQNISLQEQEVSPTTPPQDSKIQEGVNKRQKRIRKKLQEATTEKDKTQAIQDYKSNKNAAEKRGATVSNEEAAIFEQAEQELNEQGIEIDGIQVGQVLDTGAPVITQEETLQRAKESEDLNSENSVLEVVKVQRPEIKKDGKLTQWAQVDVVRRAKTVAELESDIKSQQRLKQEKEKGGQETSNEDSLIKDLKARIQEIKTPDEGPQFKMVGENAELSQQVREDLAYAKAEQEMADLVEEGVYVDMTKVDKELLEELKDDGNLITEDRSKIEEADERHRVNGVLTPAAIKEVTGWERGKDGKWRYEIEDGRLKKVENGTYKLGDIYDAPEFYKAYPDAKNIQVSISVRKGGAENSWFMPETNGIEINVKNDYRVIQDLVHELQHYIQFKEGFAIGGNENTFIENPKIVARLMKKKGNLLLENEMFRALSFVLETAGAEELQDVSLDTLFTKEFLDENDLVDEQHKEKLVSLGLMKEDADFNQLLEDFYLGKAYSGPGEIIGKGKVKITPKTFKGGLTEMQRRKMKIAKRDGDLYEALDVVYEIEAPIKEALSKLGNHAMYERLAGEVEARNATKRLYLSAERRRKTSLESTEDVAREDQILFFDSKEKQARTKQEVSEDTEADVQDIVEKINEMESGNVSTNLDTTAEGVTINTQELNERTDNKLPTIATLQIIDGIPTIFTISDQLTTGVIVNPQTGNTIDNLRGGLGFTGTEGNENAAWANTTDKEAVDIFNKAVKTYEQNKEVFEEWWKANPEFAGHIPMTVVKMGEGSILSNEATFRVLRDNLTKIPLKNRKNAVKFLKQSIKDKIAAKEKSIKTGLNDKGEKLKPLTIKNYQKEVKGHREALKTLAKLNPKIIDEVVSQEFIETLSLPARRTLIEQITFSQPNRAGERTTPSSSKKKSVPTALIEGMQKEALELVHLGPITDLITEPQLKNVPQRNIIALQAIEIGKFNPQTNELVEITLDEAIIDTKHPNYPVGTKGKTIGILENPVSVVKAYPQAYANAMSGLVAEEQKGRRMSKSAYKKLSKKDRETAPKPGELLEASVGTILTQKLGVQNGLPNAEFIGAIAQQNITKEQQLIAFMNQSFPGVVISTDQETFDNVMNSEGINKKLVDGKIIYGVTLDGDIYINPAVHNTQSEIFNTAIHEMGHVWQTFLLTTPKGKKIYKRGVELVKKTAEYQRQLEIFDGNEAKAAHEAMAILIGNKGETIADAATKSKFQEWVLGMWKYIQSSFKMSKDIKVGELQDMNLDDFLGMALADIFSGQPVRGKNARSLTKLKNPEAAFSASQSMQDVIIHGRSNGFSDAAIKIYLQNQGYTVAEIKDALTINRDLFDNTFPPAFANVPGGVNEGMKMYERTLKKIKAFKRNQNPSLKEIQEQAQLFLKRDKTFKTYNETLQQSLLIALNASLNINESAQVAQDIKKMKEVVKQRRKGAKELATLQTQLRLFIRKNFPSTQWESKEVNQLINEITNAKFYKDFENLAVKPDNDIRMVMDKVSKIVMQKRVANAVKKINKQLSIRTQKTEGGRKKGVNFLPEAVERIEKIAGDLAIDVVNYNEIDSLQARLVTAVRNNNKEDIEKIELKLSKLKADADFISEKIESLRVEFSKLQEKNEFSDEDATRMQDIEIAILYNEALLMENDNPNKADTLVNVQNLLNNLLTLERESYNEVIRQAKERYNRLKSEFLEDVSGVEVDYNDKKSVAEGKRKVRERKNMKDRNVLGKILNFILTPTGMILKRTETVEGLVSRISKGQGEMFGGKSSELIIDRLNESRRDYRKGQKQKLTRLKIKAEEIFGKNFLKVSEKNQRRNVEIILDQAKYDSLNKKLKESKSKSEKRKLQREIDGLVERYSQNEMYYLYNQYKDSANHPGFASTFEGYDHKKIMEQITSKLDPKVKEWADWQVNEFFPSVYNQYNEVYKKIYRTNMPWNKNYAGRLVRDERQEQVQDVMSIQNAYRTSVGSQSTMMRIKNKAPIKIVSGDNILSQYVDEMEYFSAYGENMRDISKMYSDPLVKKAIETFTDADVYKVLQGQLEKIIQRRNAKLTPDHPIFTASTSAFAISKLGLNPVVMVKQMTSSLAFADYIGYRNWSFYFFKEMKNGVGKYNKTWQEMYDNSPELQNRYERNDFQQIIETYAKDQYQDILGGKTIAGTSKTNFDGFRNFMMYLVKTGDKGGVMGSIPNYAYYKDQYKAKNPNATEQEAIDFAIKKTTPQILSTQQSSDIQDKDHYSTDSAVLRTFQLFTSSPRALMRKEVYAIRELHRKLMVLAKTMDPKAAAQSGKGSLKDNLRTFITYHFVVPTFFKYVALGLPGIAQDWDEDDTEQLRGWKSLLLGNIQSVFIIGDIIAGLSDAFDDKPWAGKLRNLPMFQEVSGIMENYVKYNQATKPETKEKYLQKMNFGLFSLVGLPYKQVYTALDNYGDIATGDFNGYGELMMKLLNYSKYVQEGGADKKESTSSGESKKKKKPKKIGDKAF